MLVELRVTNYALIEDLKINFCEKLNVLSGETGAGKSIVIGAINLLLGERAMVEQIRQGEDAAIIEGIVSYPKKEASEIHRILADAAIEENDYLIIAREVYRNGRSVARINGRTVPASFLKEIGHVLVDLHGQHQHQSLLQSDQHLELLDLYGGDAIISLRKEVANLYGKKQKLIKELSKYGMNEAERERLLDLYKFQYREINEAKLQEGEDEELVSREKILANSEKLCSLITDTYAELYGTDGNVTYEPVIDRVGKCYRQLSEAAQIDSSLGYIIEIVENIKSQLEEATLSLRDYRGRVEYDPHELESIQNRLTHITNLKRKYGASIKEILAYGEQVKNELHKLQDSEIIVERIENDIAEIDKSLTERSINIRKLRLEAGKVLSEELEECFNELALNNARIEVCLSDKKEVSSTGMDDVEFLFSANQGEAVKPLTKIISGGEASRVMLALKTILAHQDKVSTLIFDEVDSGIGGTTIQAVAEKLAQLSACHQVLCVTHSPQIAAMADYHFQLYKETTNDRTVTMAKLLKPEIRREELARMLDGACIDEVSLEHVDNLLNRAKHFKEKLVKSY